VKKLKARWISDYALPVSLILGMASAIPLRHGLVEEVHIMKTEATYLDRGT
jgi:hypothetical protein